MFEFAEPEFHVRGADLGGILACLLQHFVRHAQTNTRPSGPPGRQEAVDTRPTAEIDDNLTRLQRGDCLRIAAAEAEIGFLAMAASSSGEYPMRSDLSSSTGIAGVPQHEGCCLRAAARRGAGRDAAITGAHHFLVSLFYGRAPFHSLLNRMDPFASGQVKGALFTCRSDVLSAAAAY